MLAGLAFLTPAKRWVNYSADKNETSDIKVLSFNIKAWLAGGIQELQIM